jgi:amino acid efflux transporter
MLAGSLPAARAARWTPFAPHGWSAVGGAASVLMLSFVGWEAVGAAGPGIAAGVAVLLTLAAINAYMTGAAALVVHLRHAADATSTHEAADAAAGQTGGRTRGFFLAIAAAGIVELTGEAFGLLDTTRMVTLPTALFLVVYVGSMAAAARVLHGRLRVAAALACAASVGVLAFSGVAVVVALLVAAAGLFAPNRLGPQRMR